VFCPELKHSKDEYKIRNDYDNLQDRYSIAYDIIECNSEFNKNCKNTTEIYKLLKKIRFNQYNIIESIDFLDPKLLYKRPVKAKMILSNQFMLNPE